MADRPLTLRAEEVRAILDGKKTQHIVLLNPQPDPRRVADVVHLNGSWVWRNGFDGSLDGLVPVPLDRGDRLWVREAFALTQFNNAVYRADARDDRGNRWHSIAPGDPDREVLWRSPVTMPKRASRLTLVVEDARVQRVQEISSQDVTAEGIEVPKTLLREIPLSASEKHKRDAYHRAHVLAFERYWTARHGRNAWRRNDWVCAIRFRPVARNIGEGG